MLHGAPPVIQKCMEPLEFSAEKICLLNVLYHVNIWIAMAFSVLIFCVYAALILHICFRIRKHTGILLMAVGYLCSSVLYFLAAGLELKFMTLSNFEDAFK